MYEQYYGFAEKPFSLTPDPKFLYRGESHGNAFDLLQYAVRRREGFVVVTGDIGTGKTMLCRALLEQIDRTTFTALVLNPFVSMEDLLKRILLDFGIISREEVKSGALWGVTKYDLIDALNEFLLGLVPLNAGAVLIIDEAQNLPLHTLEQIRILSNLETDKEKLLQIILVGQLNLQAVLRLPKMRQLDQRVSIRYELQPLDREAVAAYVAHRLTTAGGSPSVLAFTPEALEEVHRLSAGVPRLINLICDRALLAGFSVHACRISPDMVVRAAQSLDMRPVPPRLTWRERPAPLRAAAAVVLLSATGVAGSTAYLHQHSGMGATVQAGGQVMDNRVQVSAVPPERRLPDGTAVTILAGTFLLADPATRAAVRSLTGWLEASGYQVYDAQVDLGARGRWHRVLAGAYSDAGVARVDAARLNDAATGLAARVVTAGFATGTER